MKRVFLIALTVLKLSVDGVPSASAETRMRQLPESITVEQVRKNIPQQPDQQAATQELDPSQQQPHIHEKTSDQTQLSERDRLIQERFLIKIIPAQN